MKVVSFSLEQGNKYYGKIDGDRFFIGKRVSYLGNKGLMNVVGKPDQKYNRHLLRDDFGYWADFIHPTAMAEGGLYHTLNTYDRARFTFSFLQYAAHVPNGDFVIYFRELLKLPLAREYFPELTLQNNRITKITDDGYVELESDASTSLLMDYFNPSLSQIEDTEVIQAAKLIHWAQNDHSHRQVQVGVGIQHLKEKMKRYARRYDLDGLDDTVCLVVADIRHQGRAKSYEIINALQSSDPLNSLLKIGTNNYQRRITTLRREINSLVKEGTLGERKYSIADSDFIPK